MRAATLQVPRTSRYRVDHRPTDDEVQAYPSLVAAESGR